MSGVDIEREAQGLNTKRIETQQEQNKRWAKWAILIGAPLLFILFFARSCTVETTTTAAYGVLKARDWTTTKAVQLRDPNYHPFAADEEQRAPNRPPSVTLKIELMPYEERVIKPMDLVGGMRRKVGWPDVEGGQVEVYTIPGAPFPDFVDYHGDTTHHNISSSNWIKLKARDAPVTIYFTATRAD